jgi:hypothetical protein
MGLSPIKPRDDSPEEKERYRLDREDQRKNPRNWGIEDPPHVQAALAQMESAGPALAELQSRLADLTERNRILEEKLAARRPPGRPRKISLSEDSSDAADED